MQHHPKFIQKKFWSLITFFLFFSFGWTQEVISSQGESYSSLNASIDFTLGEVVINSVSSNNLTLNQGFHQTQWDFLGIEDNKNLSCISVFPNPTNDILFISTDVDHLFNLELFDVNGKLILKNFISSSSSQMSLRNFPSGKYSLLFKDKDEVVKTFNLIKIN